MLSCVEINEWHSFARNKTELKLGDRRVFFFFSLVPFRSPRNKNSRWIAFILAADKNIDQMELNNNNDDDIASCLNELCIRVEKESSALRLLRTQIAKSNKDIVWEREREERAKKNAIVWAFHLWNCWLSAYNTYIFDDGTHDNNVTSNSFITTACYSICFFLLLVLMVFLFVVFASDLYAVPSLLRIRRSMATEKELCVRPSK